MENEVKKELKMRKLKTLDMYSMSKILKKMNLKAEISPGVKGKGVEEVGFEIILTALEHLHLAQDEINEFIGGLVGLSAAEFNDLEFEDTLKIFAMFKELKGVGNFIKSAGQLKK